MFAFVRIDISSSSKSSSCHLAANSLVLIVESTCSKPCSSPTAVLSTSYSDPTPYVRVGVRADLDAHTT